jgi:undecaprenyl pyrophosphate synthase
VTPPRPCLGRGGHEGRSQPRSGLARCRRAEALTAGNEGLLLTVAVSYGAQSDLAAAARKLAAAVAAGEIAPEQITPESLGAALSTAATVAEAGPPDLCIRTSGTQRLSNFMLFEMAYAELVFEDALWPAFGEAQLVAALLRYACQERRFGGRRGGGGGSGGSGDGGGVGGAATGWGQQLQAAGRRAQAACSGGREKQ